MEQIMTKKGEGHLTTLWTAMKSAKSKIEELEKMKIPPGKWVPLECKRCEEPSCVWCKYEDTMIVGSEPVSEETTIPPTGKGGRGAEQE